MMEKEECASKKLNRVIILVVLIITLCLPKKSYPQKVSENHHLTSRIKASFDANKGPLTDRIFNNYKREVLELGNDSIYIDLTLKQFDRRNINSGDIFSVDLLNDLIINGIDVKDKYLEILLRANFSMGNYFMRQGGSLASNSGLAKFYFEKYFTLLKDIKLSPEELEQHQIHKLEYLVKTNNDSLFYYLDRYSLPKEKENLVLTHWHRENKNHPRELFYAIQTTDLIEKMIAFGNNNEIAKADSLYTILHKEYKLNDLHMEHILYQKMGHVYFENDQVLKAVELYEKSIIHFEKYDELHLAEESLLPIGLATCGVENDKYEQYRYLNRLQLFNETKDKQQLRVLTSHLSLISKVSNLSIEKRLVEKKQIEGEQKIQKTITALGIVFFIVLTIFTILYFKRVKESNELKLANNLMKINILKSKFKPHFTFNVLSVVNYFIAKKDFENATTSLNKMAGLLRLTLENISEELVTYNSEYKICEYYMYLERLRFSDKFEFQLEPLTNSEIKNWQIPTGIIEPFLENSVNHAFNHQHKKGLITMGHKIENECLVITLTESDNGLENDTRSTRHSQGLRISKDIIKATSRLYGKALKLDIKSKNGTTVIITFPLLKLK